MNPIYLYTIDGILIISFALMCIYSFRPCREIEQKNINYNNENVIDNDNTLKYSSDYISFKNEDMENEISDNEIIQYNTNNNIINEIDYLV